MIPRMKNTATHLRRVCVIAALAAIAPFMARAADDSCDAPAKIAENPGSTIARIRDYRPIFRACSNAAKQSRVATREMTVDGRALLLTVNPATLATSIETAQCWTCADTTDEAQKDTRFLKAINIQTPSKPASPATPLRRDWGLTHGAGEGSFVTGDLCPSLKPLDRAFFDTLAKNGSHTPVALSVSGLWITRHAADFQWLREQERSGALDISWVNHSWSHPYVPGAALDRTFLLTPGVDMEREILDPERLLIASGETPSVFFRFPGLVADAALMEIVRRHHLVTLGADGWLVFAPPLKGGAIVLVHPNGNEPYGLRLFSRLAENGKLPRPFRALNEAPP